MARPKGQDPVSKRLANIDKNVKAPQKLVDKILKDIRKAK